MSWYVGKIASVSWYDGDAPGSWYVDKIESVTWYEGEGNIAELMS